MDDAAFLSRFESCTLPFDRWTHRSHVKVAYLYLIGHPFPEALNRMRAGIKAYNAANDVPEGPESGYHETMTYAWMRLIAATLSRYGPYESADAFVDAQPQLTVRQVLRFYYSKERFMSPEAKTTIVEPDLAPFPNHARG